MSLPKGGVSKACPDEPVRKARALPRDEVGVVEIKHDAVVIAAVAVAVREADEANTKSKNRFTLTTVSWETIPETNVEILRPRGNHGNVGR